MKKSLVLMAMAGVALAGCVADKEFELGFQQEQTKITFGSPVMYVNSLDSRAIYHGEVGNHQYVAGGNIYSYPREEQFVIYAVKYPGTSTFPGWDGTDEIEVQDAMFNGVTVAWEESLDGWVPKKTTGNDPYYYWPEGMKLAYAASSPADLEQGTDWDPKTNRTYGPKGLEIKDFKIPASADRHIDILFSKRRTEMTKDQMLSSADFYSGAPIEFQHALSSIHFSLKNESASEIKLRKISLYGIRDTGTFKENIDETKGLGYVRTDNGGTINVTPEWEVSDAVPVLDKSKAYVAFDATEKDGEENYVYDGVLFPENARYISEMMTEDKGLNHVLLVLPQELTTEAKLRIDYDVINDSNTTPAHKVVPLYNAPIYDTVSGAVTGVKIDKWEIGSKYVYRLVYSEGAAKKDKIYFSPSTEGWKEVGVAIIDLANAEDVTDD